MQRGDDRDHMVPDVKAGTPPDTLRQKIIAEALKRYSGNSEVILIGACLDILIDYVEEQDARINKLERSAHYHGTIRIDPECDEGGPG